MEETTIGAVLFDGIEENPYLNELYDAILYNYGRQLFGLTNLPEKVLTILYSKTAKFMQYLFAVCRYPLKISTYAE